MTCMGNSQIASTLIIRYQHPLICSQGDEPKELHNV